MNGRIRLATAAVCVAAVGFVFTTRAQEPPKPPPPDGRGLLERVAELEGESARLKAQVSKLQTELQALRGEVAKKEPRLTAAFNKAGGHIVLGDLAICFGSAELARGPADKNISHLWQFGFEFPAECRFVAPPAVTTGFDTWSEGFVVGVLKSTLTAESFRGLAWSPAHAGKDRLDVKVAMSYLAIGKVKKEAPPKQ